MGNHRTDNASLPGRAHRSYWPNATFALLSVFSLSACIEDDSLKLAGLSGQNGVITGELCYPSDWIPAMTVYARNLSTGQTFRTAKPEGSESYSLSVPSGRYHVFSWSDPASSGVDPIGQGYTDRQSQCYGLAADAQVRCLRQFSEARLEVVHVPPGERVGSIDPCDYPETIPRP